MPKPHTHKNAQITLYICRTCDTDPTRQETPAAAEGRQFLSAIRKALKQEPNLIIRPTTCLGGCEYSGTPNGCCSAGLASPGRYSYVLNKFKPATDLWKILELLKLYRQAPQGIIHSANSQHAEQLRPHIATRVPPPK